MDMGHLYHDSYFSSLAIELAVKEKLKTREINAREDRTLEQTSRSFDKAKSIYEKNSTFERWKVGRSLQKIWERTPGLDNSLAVEKARVDALEKNILGRCLDPASKSSHVSSLSNGLQISEPSGSYLVAGHGARRRKRKERSRKEKPLNTELNRNSQRQADFVKRSEHTVKALARLNCRKEKRQRDHEIFRRDLIEFSRPLIDRAKVILKGKQDLDVEQFFREFENFVTHGGGRPGQADHYTLSDSRSNLTVGSGHSPDVLRLQDGDAERLTTSQPDYFLGTDTASLTTHPGIQDSSGLQGDKGDIVGGVVSTSPTEDISKSLHELKTFDTNDKSWGIVTPSHFSEAKNRKSPGYKHAHPLPPIQAKKEHVTVSRCVPKPYDSRASHSGHDVTEGTPATDVTSLPASTSHVLLEHNQLTDTPSLPNMHRSGFGGTPSTMTSVVWLPQVWRQRNRRRLLSEKSLATRLRRKRNAQLV